MSHSSFNPSSRRVARLQSLAVSLIGGYLLFLGPSFASAAGSGSATDPSTVAVINGKPVSMSELEALAGEPLNRLEMQRRQVLEEALTRLVDNKLIEAEAEQRGVQATELLAAELGDSMIVDDAEVDAWYEQNQARIRQPKEAVADQIREMLVAQRSAGERQELLQRLRQKHEVNVLLEPYRLELGASDATVPFEGSADAPVEVVMFSDFQCPFCRNVAPAAHGLTKTFGDQVKVSFRHLPLMSIHPRAKRAGEVAACAQQQGKFWPLHDAIFERFGELEEDQLRAIATTAGLETKALEACLKRGDGLADVERDMALARSHGITRTPSIFVNGRPVALKQGPTPEEQISSVVADELRRVKR